MSTKARSRFVFSFCILLIAAGLPSTAATITFSMAQTETATTSFPPGAFDPPAVFGIDGGVGRDLTPGNEYSNLPARADNEGIATYISHVQGQVGFRNYYIPFPAAALEPGEDAYAIFSAVTGFTDLLDSTSAGISPETGANVNLFSAGSSPKPASFALLGAGLVAAGFLRRRLPARAGHAAPCRQEKSAPPGGAFPFSAETTSGLVATPSKSTPP